MMKSKILVRHSEGGQVAHLTLNSPNNLNAMDLEMAEAFRQVSADMKASPPRVVVISAEGRAFSAGGDLAMLKAKAEKDHETNRREMMEFYLSFLGLRDLNVPLVCAIQGHAVGAGFCFAAACDVRVADESALFAAPFTRLGLHPGMGGSFFLPRSLGSELARELVLTGRRLNAADALRAGFLTRVVGLGSLLHAAEEIVEGVLKGAPHATRSLLANERERERAAVQAALEQEAQEQALSYARPEFLEGVQALCDRRNPQWGG